jgi:GTP cyclohydrolase I
MLPDIQDQYEPRHIPIDRVGITGVRYPTRFSDSALDQQGVATFDLLVALPGDRRGTHMSRMVELIHDHLQELDPAELPRFLKTAAAKLDVDSLEVRASLPIVTRVTSPASGRSSWQPSDVALSARLGPTELAVETLVSSEVTSLCPCSKAISDYGAHNQRSRVSVTVVGSADAPYPLPVHHTIELIRQTASCPIYPLVKRPDERAITMTAYDHPAFVEDMARDLSQELRGLELEHRVTVQNFESIHSHDAIASLSWSPSDR